MYNIITDYLHGKKMEFNFVNQLHYVCHNRINKFLSLWELKMIKMRAFCNIIIIEMPFNSSQ